MFIFNVNRRVAKLLKGRAAEWAEYFLVVERITDRKAFLMAVEPTSPGVARRYNFAIMIAKERGDILGQ
jgi:hypothetical protein